MFAKIKKNYFFLVFVFFLIYFLFNLFSGERGLISFIDKKRTLFELENQENYLKKRNDDLELKNSLLSSKMKNGKTVNDNLLSLITKIGEKITLGRCKTLNHSNSKIFKYHHFKGFYLASF